MDFRIFFRFALFQLFIRSPASQGSETGSSASSTCRRELNDYHSCLKSALDKTRLNRTAVDIGVKKCFEDNQCSTPNLTTATVTMTDSQRAVANRRLQQSPFKNVDWTTFDQCKISVNTKARDRVRACVINQIPSFGPGIDEDINDDGEEDAIIERNLTFGSYAVSKLADSESICGDSSNRAKVKQCILQVFSDSRPGKDGMKKNFDDYCDSRDTCKASLPSQCANQLNQTHRLLCQCTVDKIASSEGDDLRDEFLTCTKVDSDQRSSLSKSIDSNPHRVYASTAFCHAHFDPCSWLWRQLADEAASPDVIRSIIDQLTSNGDADHLNQVARHMLKPDLGNISFYNNETDGQLGEILSGAFDAREINHMLGALSAFANPYNASVDERALMSNSELVSDLVSHLVGNNSEAEQVAAIGSKFFGYENSNGTLLPEDIQTLVARLIDPQLVEGLEMALSQFMYPNGNMSMANVTDRDALSSLLSNIRDQGAGEDSKILAFVDRFQHPSQVFSDRPPGAAQSTDATDATTAPSQ